MNILIDFNQLCGVLSDFVQIGFMEAVRAYEPVQDKIRKSEIKKWLKISLIDNDKFDALVESGHIHAHRLGTSKNSPLYFSKKEIKEAVAKTKLANILSRYGIESEKQKNI